jgi:hypothetical protein
MATYKARIKTVSAGSAFEVTTESGCISTAREQIEKLYDPIYIYDLREVRGDGGSSGSGIGDVSGTVALVGLFAAAWAFMAFTPWILMTLGGAAGTWIGEKVTRKSIDEINEGPSNSVAGSIILILMILGGGFGFVKGDEIKKGFDAPSDTPSEVQPAK